MNKNIIIFDLPTKSFKVAKLQELYDECNKKYKKVESDNGDDQPIGLKQLKKIYQPIITYVKKYYYETQKGNYLFYDVKNDRFMQKERKDFINEVMVKIDKKLFDKLFEKNDCIFSIVSKIDMPRVYQDEDGDYIINECRGFLHKEYKPYNQYSKDIKAKVQIVLDMIKEISCGNNEDFYQAYLKYLSQLCRGIKTKVIIYKKSMQGCGKSTESDFLMKYVLGTDISMICGTEPLLTNYNMCLLGQLFVVFEELPTFGESQWSGASSKLKTMTTESTMMYRALYNDPIKAENISNFMINTNCESIKDSHGRRIVIMPVNNSRMGDYKYFSNIKNNCFNNDVGEAFYSYMMSIDVEGWLAEEGFPETDSKRIAISELLPSHMKFLKFEYVLRNRGISYMRPDDLHNEYATYCQLNNIKGVLGKNKFIEKLKEDLNIIPTKKNGYFKYDITYEKLKDIADRFKWICAYDEVQNDFIDNEEEENNDDIGYKAKYEKAMKRIKELERQIKELTNNSK